MASICSRGKRSDVIEFPLPRVTFCNGKILYKISFKFGLNSPVGSVPGNSSDLILVSCNSSTALALAGLELDTDQDRRNDWLDTAEVEIVPVVVATARLAGEEDFQLEPSSSCPVYPAPWPWRS